jgi:hypothetical protein
MAAAVFGVQDQSQILALATEFENRLMRQPVS